MRRIGGNTPLALPSFLLLIVLLLSAQLVSAQQPDDIPQVPPFGGGIYIQTSGPNTDISTGDYYTNSAQGDGGVHRVQINVPCAWLAGVPVTFAAFDPESFDDANPGTETDEDEAAGQPATNDEVRGGADNTTFRVISPTGVELSNQTFAPNSGAHLLWVELLTFDPAVTGCGTYLIESTTPIMTSNSWVLRAGHDP